MLGFGSIGFGQLANPDQRTRLDPGAIEPGVAQFGNVMFGGPAFPAASGGSGSGQCGYWLVEARRHGKR
jgi:hypothetical protein